jgi:hypothetical protein
MEPILQDFFQLQMELLKLLEQIVFPIKFLILEAPDIQYQQPEVFG